MRILSHLRLLLLQHLAASQLPDPQVDNRYRRFPLFVGSRHMPFHDWPGWNARAQDWNTANNFAS